MISSVLVISFLVWFGTPKTKLCSFALLKIKMFVFDSSVLHVQPSILCCRYSLLVTGEAYVDTDALGSPISFQTRNVTRTVYNGSLVNSTFTFNGLLPHSSYQVQVNASNRAGFIMSNLIAFSTSQDGKLSRPRW